MATTARNQARVADLLDRNDDTVASLLAELQRVATVTERARLVQRLVRAVSVHDAVVAEALCPLLYHLPEGSAVADDMKLGCAQRETISAEIISVLSGVAARDVYLVPAEGTRLDELVASLAASFERHERTEVPRAVAVADGDPSAEASDIAESMDHARHWAPTRPHRGPLAHRRAVVAKALLHLLDRILDMDAEFNEGMF